MLPVKVAQSYSTQTCGSLAEKPGFASVKGRKEKNGFVARVARRRGLFQGRHKGVYLRPESLTERVEEVLLLCGLFDLISGDLNLRYQAYESRTA
jgi:hypothetical protein